mmetsp:Transcript_128309/g.304631  ORF Transcript_128309/g.304631 Transcript_128309/m.304631 type:complete len:98 (-) Transcript_128309:28-321(-)|eukprot:CAMPEP_0181396666 /NCGR_PEP_ID=MMETSP1110-20121109/30_1 /TAXON_ID=174948 /ORGANISM="Symbiodinium sp., Strain CCMP421" /LENGTH=97 /DNA_ID=CAMNT_0023518367 /DNA_START=42 /DNA_END=335 /DNA_ORIENTATION=-
MERRVKYANFHQEPPALRPPKVPIKELLLAVVLFIVGTVCLLCGANVFFKTSLQESMPFNLLGGLCFIPGAYHTFIFIMIFKKVPGYSYDMIATYSN